MGYVRPNTSHVLLYFQPLYRIADFVFQCQTNKKPSESETFFHSGSLQNFMLILDLKEHCRKSAPKKKLEPKNRFFLRTSHFWKEKGVFRDNLFMVDFFLNIPSGLISIIKLWILSTNSDLFQGTIFTFRKYFLNFFLHEITKSAIQRLKRCILVLGSHSLSKNA